jgi:hypothetical protein
MIKSPWNSIFPLVLIDSNFYTIEVLEISLYCIVLYLFQIPSNPYTGQGTSHKPQDIESVITIQYKMFQQKNVST